MYVHTYKRASTEDMWPLGVLRIFKIMGRTSLVNIIVCCMERWGAGVETQKNVRGEVGGWGRVPFNETYAPSLSTIYDGA